MISNAYTSPDVVFGPLFKAVQLSGIFPDSKTFVDCTPRKRPDLILSKYEEEKQGDNFNLKAFVLEHFELPEDYASDFVADTNRPVDEHINALWEVLTRRTDKAVKGSSLIPLPNSYIVPGGRFGEIYYWDSYFTMLGLHEAGKSDMIENMVNNFSYLIDEFGYIPNGNRTYFLGRSQPPFYSLMVRLLMKVMGEEVLEKYLPHLEKEYAFWMRRSQDLNEDKRSANRVVLMPDGSVLNRYWDDKAAPRQESYAEDVELSHSADREANKLFRNLRAACESGWDFSARWFADPKDFSSIKTTELIPIDLNTLLYHLEHMIARGHALFGNRKKLNAYRQRASQRKKSLLKYCWDHKSGYFIDFDFVKGERTEIPSLATAFPLFFYLATPAQAATVAQNLKKHFLKPGGLVSTLVYSGQQWDAPNGWAPLQWMAIKGLRNYGFHDLAGEIKRRWVALNTRVYKNTGKMVEKYNVEDMSLLAGGGEYPVQDGFGWSNGVLLKLIKE